MPIPAEVAELVERFERNYKSYIAPTYNEEQLRIEFVNPFFKALGWDMSNESGFAEQYKDVIHEDALKMGGTTKSPDYCFRIGGARKFYLETKRPGVNIVLEPGPAFQLRRYAYTANLPLSVLTNFRDLAVYDGRIQPDKKDAPKKALLKSINFLEYADNWDWIEKLFSRQGILKGAFDLYATEKTRRGTSTFDVAFLREIEGWREMLAQHIAARNTLSESELNIAVGRIIDRIIFLRICEERGIEPKNPLMALKSGVNTYKRLVDLFNLADARYNSGLFHFYPEAGRHEEPDEITPKLKIDNAPLKDVLSRLYYPDSPYAFNVMPLEILGQIYEQFLGKVIRLNGKSAVVEEKPEVKKAGGVYYTPAYIVEHIVKQTVGALCLDKTPTQVAKLRFLDPACGSGSFLLGVYDWLLRWHLDWYLSNEPQKHAAGKTPTVFQVADSYQLTPRERKRIVRDNIFGVDIDRQAVEVTKLSLLLKVLEGENDESVSAQLRLLKERALPDLGDNIKCGNSLIAPDFEFDAQGNPRAVSVEERRRVNAFDWNIEYSNVFKNGGFDAIVGNPPYLYSAGQANADYYQQFFKLKQYQTDFYVYFVEKALELTRNGGKVSFIIPDSWLNGESFSELRNHLLAKHRIDRISVFDYTVFKKVTLENSIFAVTKSAAPETIVVERFFSPDKVEAVNEINPTDCVTLGLIDPKKSFGAEKIIKKMEKGTVKLENLILLNRGIHAYRTDGYGKSKNGVGHQTVKDKEEKSYHADSPLDDTFLPELKGKDIDRFSFKATGTYLSYGEWLAEPRSPEFFHESKVALRKILGPKLHGTFILEPMALDQSLYILISKDGDEKLLKFILGVLLSKVGAWYLRTKYSIYDTLYPWYTKKQLAGFPIKGNHDTMVKLVERMLELQRALAQEKSVAARTALQTQIAATDRQIDKLVYALYELSDEEIALVEGA